MYISWLLYFSIKYGFISFHRNWAQECNVFEERNGDKRSEGKQEIFTLLQCAMCDVRYTNQS